MPIKNKGMKESTRKMKHKKKKATLSKFTAANKLRLVVVTVFAVIGVVLLRQSLATTGLYLSSPSSVQKNSEFTVELVLNTAEAVDGVEASLTYDQSKLEFISIDGGGSAFPISLQQSGGDGTVTVIRGKLDGQISGELSVANVKFKALAIKKSTTINLSGNATSAGSYTDPDTTGITIEFSKPGKGGGAGGGKKSR